MLKVNLITNFSLPDADRLTKDAQHALRRTMEKYMSKCRVIMCTNSISKMIPAIRSRCLGPALLRTLIFVKEHLRHRGTSCPEF